LKFREKLTRNQSYDYRLRAAWHVVVPALTSWGKTKVAITAGKPVELFGQTIQADEATIILAFGLIAVPALGLILLGVLGLLRRKSKTKRARCGRGPWGGYPADEVGGRTTKGKIAFDTSGAPSNIGDALRKAAFIFPDLTLLVLLHSRLEELRNPDESRQPKKRAGPGTGICPPLATRTHIAALFRLCDISNSLV
jgi:hypothetical protein